MEMKPKGSKSRGYWACVVAFFAFVVLGVLTIPILWPPFGVFPLAPKTQGYFKFQVQEHDIFLNGTIKTLSVVDGYIRLSGTGGLGIDNKLNLELRLKFHTINVPILNHSAIVIRNPNLVKFHPAFAEYPANSVDLRNPPKFWNLTVRSSNAWDNSSDVEWFVSGMHGVYLEFIENSTSHVQFLLPNVIQIGDETSFVSAVNNQYVDSLTFFVIALVILELRPEQNGEGNCNTPNANPEQAEGAQKTDNKSVPRKANRQRYR
jgi:hypothetical protein